MKKILIAFDGGHFSKGALEFARNLNKMSPVFVTGAFLQGGALFIPRSEMENPRTVTQNIRKFETFCKRNKIKFRTHKDMFDFAIPQIKKESRFADMLILASEKFFEQAGTEKMNDFLKTVLADVECPVVVVPEKYEFPLNSVLTYDGGKESVYAIKQFVYLFPQLASRPGHLVYVGSNKRKDFPDLSGIEELVSCHFKKMKICRLVADPQKDFASWLKRNTRAIVVSGAFSNPGISRIFHKSFVHDVIRDHRVPVFIAHN